MRDLQTFFFGLPSPMALSSLSLFPSLLLLLAYGRWGYGCLCA